MIGAHTDDPLVRKKASRRITSFGTRQPPEALAEVLSREDIEKFEQRAIVSNVKMLPARAARGNRNTRPRRHCECAGGPSERY